MIDQRLIGAFDHIAAWLQKERGIPLPSILKNAMMAVVTSFVLKILFEALDGATVSLLIDVVLAALLGKRIWLRLETLSNHESAAWSPRLAMLYQASAIAQRELRPIRIVRLLIVAGFVVMDIPSTIFMALEGATPMGIVNVTMSLALIADLYFACAMPHTPSRREKRETFFEAAPSAV